MLYLVNQHGGTLAVWKISIQKQELVVDTMGIIFRLMLVGCLFGGSQVHARSDHNPFAKRDEIYVGSAAAWQQQDGQLLKSHEADDGHHYHLSLSNNRLRLRIGGQQPGDTKSFSSLAIEDVSVDGQRLPVFQWCLNKQSSHNRFLAQGETIERGVCRNDGSRGEFSMELAKQTIESILSGGRLSFRFKPYRKSVDLHYDLAGLKETYIAMLAPKSAQTVRATAAPEPEPAPVRNCEARPPQNLSMIKPVIYPCDDVVARQAAERKILGAVKIEQERVAAVKAQQERARQAKLEEEKRLAEQKKAEEEAASIAQNETTSNAILDEFATKMLGICNKMWARGEHRCYCEKYLDKAPAGVESDPSCS